MITNTTMITTTTTPGLICFCISHSPDPTGLLARVPWVQRYGVLRHHIR